MVLVDPRPVRTSPAKTWQPLQSRFLSSASEVQRVPGRCQALCLAVPRARGWTAVRTRRRAARALSVSLAA